MEKNINLLLEVNQDLLNNINFQFTDNKVITSEEIDKFKQRINQLTKEFKQEHFKNLRKGKYKSKIGIVYSDAYNELITLSRLAIDSMELLAA